MCALRSQCRFRPNHTLDIDINTVKQAKCGLGSLLTKAAAWFAKAVGSFFLVVGVSSAPKAETISEIPAALYSALTEARLSALIEVHSVSLSDGPEVIQNANALEEKCEYKRHCMRGCLTRH